MPMENTHFVEKESVNCVFDYINWEEVTGTINHESPPYKLGLVIDEDGNPPNKVVI